MMHPDTEVRYISAEKGYGVFATRAIPAGTITWILDPLDRIFTQQQIESLQEPWRRLLEKYTFRDRHGDHVLCWDHGRFVNHSSRANCLTTAYDFELAVRDIAADEEVTDDYGYLNLSEPFEALPEPGTKRRQVYPDDLKRYYRIWDAKLESAFPRLEQVDQPLLSLLPEATRRRALAVARGEEPMESILGNYYADPQARERAREARRQRRRERAQSVESETRAPGASSPDQEI